AQWKYQPRRVPRREVQQRSAHGNIRITPRVTRVSHHQFDGPVGGTDKAAPFPVKTHARLRRTAFVKKLEAAGIKRKISGTQNNGASGLAAGDRVPALAGCADVNAIVQTPREACERDHACDFIVRISEAGEDDPPHVRRAVSFGVLEVKDFRTRGDEYAAAVTDDRRRVAQILGVQRADVERAGSLAVFEQPDAPRRSFQGIARFDDEQSAVFVEGHRQRVEYERVRGGEFEPKAWLDAEAV